jgi:endo-1,4-beta-xylanase
VRDFYTVAFSHPNVVGITLWGFYDGCHWMPGAGFWRKDDSPKTAADVYKDLLTRQWHTDETVTTNSSGLASVRGFHGTYDVVVKVGNMTKTARPVLSQDGTRVKVVVE